MIFDYVSQVIMHFISLGTLIIDGYEVCLDCGHCGYKLCISILFTMLGEVVYGSEFLITKSTC